VEVGEAAFINDNDSSGGDNDDDAIAAAADITITTLATKYPYEKSDFWIVTLRSAAGFLDLSRVESVGKRSIFRLETTIINR